MVGHHHMVSVLIDNNVVNTTLTREPFDMIDSNRLVVKLSTFVRGHEAGLWTEETCRCGQGSTLEVDRRPDKGLTWCGTSFTM